LLADAFDLHWHYYIDPTRGVFEDYDYTPKSNPRMVKGKEIIWGNKVNIGDVIQGQCVNGLGKDIAAASRLGERDAATRRL
jgi:hypothetical protein